jgi:hypothetical protein
MLPNPLLTMTAPSDDAPAATTEESSAGTAMCRSKHLVVLPMTYANPTMGAMATKLKKM